MPENVSTGTPARERGPEPRIRFRGRIYELREARWPDYRCSTVVLPGEVEPCVCVHRCGDRDPDGTGTCKGLPDA